MLEISRVLATIALVFAVVLSADVLSAQENPAHDHIGHLTTAFPQTPGGEGLLPTAMAEVEVAIQHAGLAARHLGDFDAMKRHMSHVLHAVAAPEGSSRPARGFGAKRAAEGIARHLELAAASDGASAAVQTQAAFGVVAARSMAQRADEIVALSARIEAAGTPAQAAPLVQELQTLVGHLMTGVDETGDGRIWQAGEGGLDQVQHHVGFIMAAEGL